jgi:signal peptidase I
VSVARPDKASRGGALGELVLIVVVALGLALVIQALLVKPYRIPSQSMEPTLAVGQRVLVDRIGNRFGNPHDGDIVVFHPPAGADSQNRDQCGRQPPSGEVCLVPTPEKSDSTFIKRVVGVPGDRIAIVDGHVIRNGKRVSEPYMRDCGGGPDCTFPTEVTVPAGEYFMMGDNRGDSDDSRFWGPVPRDWIIGGAFATYWPPKRIGIL